MKSPLPFIFIVTAIVTACGGSAPSTQNDAQKVAAALSGDDKHVATDNPVCKLFTPTEAATYIGEPVGAPGNASGGCQWMAVKSDGWVRVFDTSDEYHEVPSHAKGFKELPAVGKRGYVSVDWGGWGAGAIVGTRSISVSVVGATASEASAVALLKESIKRSALPKS